MNMDGGHWLHFFTYWKINLALYINFHCYYSTLSEYKLFVYKYDFNSILSCIFEQFLRILGLLSMTSGKCSLKLRYSRDAVIERLPFGHAEGTTSHHLKDDETTDDE